MRPSGPRWRSITVVYGRFDPRRDHVAPPLAETTVPRSVPTTSRPLLITMSFTGMSGRLPLTSVHVPPPSVVFQRWPRPAPGPSVQRRENPLKPRYAVLPDASAGSIAIAET